MSGRDRNGKGSPPPERDLMFEKEVKAKLEEFRNTLDAPGTELPFPPTLDRHQRRFVHTTAYKLGLISQSRGRDQFRHCVVTKKRPVNLMTSANWNEAEPVSLTPEQRAPIASLIQTYPITDDDIDDHIHVTTAESDRRQRDEHAPTRGTPLVPPPPHPSPDIQRVRNELPATRYRQEVINAIQNNKVSLITGGTGCGKTTQVPQFLLEHATQTNTPLRIICTQPRRLPAIAVADRVSNERGEKLGTTVGYHIRLEQRTSASTVLTYCTSGVLLRMLTMDELASDATHIILDEIHEREQNTDYLLIALRQALQKRREDLKVILMSATMEGNLEMFMKYFEKMQIARVDIPSRLYHVERFFLADVIALTGYAPPQSLYGGIFTTFDDNASSSFPRVDTWDTTEDNNWGSGSWQKQQNDKQDLRMVHSVSSFGQYGGPSTQPQQQPAFPTRTPAHDQQIRNLAQQMIQQSASSMMHTRSSSSVSQQNMYAVPMAGQQWQGDANVMDVPMSNEDAVMYEQKYREMGYQIYPQQQQQPAMHNSYGVQQNWGHYPSQPNMSTMQWQPAASSHMPMHTQQQPMFYVQNEGPDSNPAYYQQNSFDSSNGFGSGRGFSQRSISASGNLSDADQFGMRIREQETQANNMRNCLRNIIPYRPDRFEKKAVELLRRTMVDDSRVVNMYLKCGGQQWLDSIDIDLALAVVKYCMNSPIFGSILVFLPGFDDIQTLRDKIVNEQWTAVQPVLCILHSQVNTQEQQRVFSSVKNNQRKVILSTNIAEASLTIDDVVFVVDCGKVKEKSYDHQSRISQLKVVWIAKSNAEQRSGRAGRCREGFCFRLYSKEDYNTMLLTQVAEMQRSAIHDVCLHAKMFAPDRMSVKEFLQLAPEPPGPDAVESSLNFLEQLGALYSENSRVFGGEMISRRGKEPDLTHLGKLIAHLPLDPQLARLLLFGYALRCFQPVVTLVALLSYRDPFCLATGDEKGAALQARDDFAKKDFSDHIMLLRAFNLFQNIHMPKQIYWCKNNYINHNSMKMILGIRRQLVMELRRIRFIWETENALFDPFLNEYSNCWPMVQAAIVAGCHPCIGFVKAGSKLRKIRTCSERTAQLHPSTSLRRQLFPSQKKGGDGSRSSVPDPTIEYLVFQEYVKIDEGLTIRTVTAVPPSTVVLFGGQIRLPKETLNAFHISNDEAIQMEDNVDEEDFFQPQEMLELDNWLTVKGRLTDLTYLLQLRFKVMSYFLSVLAHPPVINEKKNRDLLKVLSAVIAIDHERHGFQNVQDLGYQTSDDSRVPDYSFGSLYAHSSASSSRESKDSKPQNEAPRRVHEDGEKREDKPRIDSSVLQDIFKSAKLEESTSYGGRSDGPKTREREENGDADGQRKDTLHRANSAREQHKPSTFSNDVRMTGIHNGNGHNKYNSYESFDKRNSRDDERPRFSRDERRDDERRDDERNRGFGRHDERRRDDGQGKHRRGEPFTAKFSQRSKPDDGKRFAQLNGYERTTRDEDEIPDDPPANNDRRRPYKPPQPPPPPPEEHEDWNQGTHPPFINTEGDNQKHRTLTFVRGGGRFRGGSGKGGGYEGGKGWGDDRKWTDRGPWKDNKNGFDKKKGGYGNKPGRPFGNRSSFNDSGLQFGSSKTNQDD